MKAADYMSMIRYDRIWECVSYDEDGDIIKCLRFDGAEEIDGKVYHKLVAFRKTRAVYQNSLKSYVYETDDNLSDPEGYLREEDGKVYTLVCEENDMSTGVLYTCPDDKGEKDRIDEKLIYDFNAIEDDTLTLYSFIMKGGTSGRFKVLETGSVIVEDEECRTVTVVNETVDEISGDISQGLVNTVIEGIGTAEYGCLNHTEHMAIPAGFWYHNYVNRVFNLQGDVIFESYGGVKHEDLHYGPFSSVAEVENPYGIQISDMSVSFGDFNVANSLIIYNPDGRMMRISEGSGRQSISTVGMLSGIYIAVAMTEGRAEVRCKFVVR